MTLLPPTSNRTDTLLPYTTLFRSVSHRLAHVQADVRVLGVGVRAPGDDQPVQPLSRIVQRVRHGHARGGDRHVGEAVRHAGVAGRVDRGVVGAQVFVDVDAADAVVGDAGRVARKSVV